MQNISKSYCISVLADQKCALHVLVAFEAFNMKISYFKNKLHVRGGLFCTYAAVNKNITDK